MPRGVDIHFNDAFAIMKLSLEEINAHKEPFFREFLCYLNEYVGDKWNIRFRIHCPSQKCYGDLAGIDKSCVVILWGDEYSQKFPDEFVNKAGAVIKCYCPEEWMARGIIPMTDNAMVYTSEPIEVLPCSLRPYTVMYSSNLNFRRTDIYRAMTGRSFGYPFRISSNYPVTGKYPFWHKLEAVLMHKIITCFSHEMDFSHLYPDSYIRFHAGFMQGGLTDEAYTHKITHSKIVWSTAGYMTNETSRLLEAARAGCVIITGKLPDTPIYKGHPFYVIDDWRKVRSVTDALLNDDARMDEMGFAAKAWYDGYFSPRAQAERIAACLLS